jgi:hypothetical protein
MIFSLSLDYGCFSQILRCNETDLVNMIIRTKIDQFDSKAASQEHETQINERRTVTVNVIGTSHVSLGSPLPAMTLGELEIQFSDDSAFRNLRKRLNKRSSSLFKLSTAIRFESIQQVYIHIILILKSILIVGLIDRPLSTSACFLSIYD